MNEPSDSPRARVIEVNGQLQLDDPDARAMMKAVAQHSCLATAKNQRDRILYFVDRMRILEKPAHEVLITCINVDARYGADFADALMPGTDWQSYRDRGEIPFARGLALRPPLQLAVSALDPEVGEKMKTIPGIVVLVVDHGVVEVFPILTVLLP